MAELQERRGFRIHLVVKPVIITSTPPDLAESLRLAWLPDGNGIVVVYESDTRSLGIGRRMTEDPAGEGPRVPTHVSAVIIKEVLAATDKPLPTEAYLEVLTANLTAAFDDYFRRHARPLRPRGRRARPPQVGARRTHLPFPPCGPPGTPASAVRSRGEQYQVSQRWSG